jgi:hypothetical protein
VDEVKVAPQDSKSMKVAFEGPNGLEGVIDLVYHVTLQSKFDPEPMVSIGRGQDRLDFSLLVQIYPQ